MTLAVAPATVIGALQSGEGMRSVHLDGDGREQLDRIGVRVGTIPLYRSIRLVVGDAASDPRADHLMLPVSWEVSDGPPVFPRMDGILMVGPARGGGTALTLNATYDPPLGRLGELMDRILMHRVAGQIVHDFLQRLASVLVASVGARD